MHSAPESPGVGYQTAKCPLCGDSRAARQFEDAGYEVRRCANCGLFFIHPYPEDADLQHGHVIDYDYEKLKLEDAAQKYRAEVRTYDAFFDMIEQQTHGAESILDVGCGAGHLLERLGRRESRLQRVGIELNRERAAVARRKAACEIHQVPIENFSSEERFDVITMINVLSHIPDFDALFSALRSLLRPKGRLILKVGELAPDVRHNDLFEWGVPDHLHFLGFPTLDFICRKYGLRKLVHRREPYSRYFFSQSRWRAPARGWLRNTIKRVVVTVPYLLSLLAWVYDRRHGGRVVSSFVVLTPSGPGETGPAA
jgi:SAM-dependent methyltransferase